ncbi:MAG: SIMPL domain-containing protein [Nanoarchaeota archaeon]
MEKSIKITLIIASTVLILGLLGFITFNGFVDDSNPSNTVTSQGSSVIKVVPDVVTVYFSVQTRDKTADSSQKNNSEIVDKLTNKLILAGFSKDDLKTQGFSVYPEYDWSNGDNKIKGYLTSHDLKLEISAENSDDIGKAIDAATESGVLVSSINFELSKELEEKYKTEALQEATANARAKADAIAKGLDKEVARVVSVSTSDFNYYPWRSYSLDSSIAEASYGESAALAKQAAVSINPSEREVTAQVTVVFKLN